MSERLRRVVDRSPKMVAAAARRNAAYVEAGTAEFVVGSLERWLAPGGILVSEYD